MKIIFSVSLLIAFASYLLPTTSIAQPKTDCVCNGSSAGGGKLYAGIGGDFHLANFENDDRKMNISTLGFGMHIGYNLNKKFSLQLGLQKYGLSGMEQPEKLIKINRYSYFDASLLGVYRFIKRGSRFIPYLQFGYVMNSTLKREYSDSEEKGFKLMGHYTHLGGGSLFVLANNFTLYSEIGLNIHPSVFKGTYASDIFKLKPGLSVGINYHF